MPCPSAKITTNLLRDCDKPLVRGVQSIYYVGHLSQIASLAYNATNRLIIEGIVMKTGEKMKQYEGFGFSTKPSVTFSRTDFGTTKPQTFVFAVSSNTPEIDQQIEILSGASDLFVIYKRNGLYGEWKSMGLEVGMRIEDGGLTQSADDEANKGAWIVTLTGSDADKAPHTVRHTTASLIDTDAYLLTLATPIV